jgi:hypothetical protein
VNFKSAKKLKLCSDKTKIMILTVHHVQMTMGLETAKWRQKSDGNIN